jgi:hypothetical protein
VHSPKSPSSKTPLEPPAGEEPAGLTGCRPRARAGRIKNPRLGRRHSGCESQSVKSADRRLCNQREGRCILTAFVVTAHLQAEIELASRSERGRLGRFRSRLPPPRRCELFADLATLGLRRPHNSVQFCDWLAAQIESAVGVLNDIQHSQLFHHDEDATARNVVQRGLIHVLQSDIARLREEFAEATKCEAGR